MQPKKIVIWGHKPKFGLKFGLRPRRSHTHSYIHQGYFKAFEYLGYETHWFDDNDDVTNFDFSNSIFFTEDQVSKNIPLIKDSRYVLHHCNTDKYDDQGIIYMNLCNYVADNQKGVSFNYPSGKVQKISDIAYFDEVNRALYQPWATDLLPFEILNQAPIAFRPETREVNYVGTIGHDNIKDKFKIFLKEVSADKKKFNLHTGLDEISARQVIQRSAISIDIRGNWHIERGYIPCRIWKSLSYGKYIGSNSPLLHSIFGDFINIDQDEKSLYWSTRDKYASIKPLEQVQAMKWVAASHTYLNRAELVLKTLNEI